MTSQRDQPVTIAPKPVTLGPKLVEIELPGSAFAFVTIGMFGTALKSVVIETPSKILPNEWQEIAEISTSNMQTPFVQILSTTVGEKALFRLELTCSDDQGPLPLTLGLNAAASNTTTHQHLGTGIYSTTSNLSEDDSIHITIVVQADESDDVIIRFL